MIDRKGIKKHWDVFQAWINGKEIESRGVKFYTADGTWQLKPCYMLTKWRPDIRPQWYANMEYRVKPEPAKIPWSLEKIVSNAPFTVKSRDGKYFYCVTSIDLTRQKVYAFKLYSIWKDDISFTFKEFHTLFVLRDGSPMED